MSYVTEKTEWPSSGVPGPIKELLRKFFALMDDKGSFVGDILADEIFTANGVLKVVDTLQGAQQIRRSRDNAWKEIESREHTIHKVYAANDTGDDLLMLGNVSMSLRNGQDYTAEFSARMVVDLTSSEHPKLKLYQAWTDSAPLTRALSKPTNSPALS